MAIESPADVVSYQMYIGGQWVGAKDGSTFTSTSPFSGKVWATLPVAGAADIDAAVQAARDAFPAWSKMLAKDRARILRRFAILIEENADHLAQTETRDNGKLLREMLGQVKGLPDYYNYWAGWADKITGTVAPLDKPTIFHYIAREPLGVVAAMVAWNSPLLLLTWKLGPALALGNTVVAKPSQQASASTLELAKLAEMAGFPPGVLNVITGPGASVGETLAGHPGVNKIAFTGGPEGGRQVAHAAADNFTPISLELGGKSPNIVFEDADFETAVTGAMAGIFGASGQTCIAGSRLLVQRSIADRFVARLAERAKMIKLGDPAEAETEMGPVCFPAQQQKIKGMVDRAVESGATIVIGGRVPDANPNLAGGYFYEPTILANVTPDMEIAQDEVFGPVLAVLPFDTDEDAIRIANSSKYGLASGVWTRDISRAHKMVQALEAGIVWVNTYRAASYAAPWGGVKSSGYGRESSEEAIHEYTRAKSVWIETAREIADPFTVR
jgi:aldehyde dehydrogenase (NAD+)